MKAFAGVPLCMTVFYEMLCNTIISKVGVALFYTLWFIVDRNKLKMMENRFTMKARSIAQVIIRYVLLQHVQGTFYGMKFLDMCELPSAGWVGV